MAVAPTRHNDAFSTAPQISTEDLAQIAAMGFKTVINNRPDGEGGAEHAEHPGRAVQVGEEPALGGALDRDPVRGHRRQAGHVQIEH